MPATAAAVLEFLEVPGVVDADTLAEPGFLAALDRSFADGAAARDQDLDRIMDRVNERFGKVLRRGGPPRRGEG